MCIFVLQSLLQKNVHLGSTSSVITINTSHFGGIFLFTDLQTWYSASQWTLMAVSRSMRLRQEPCISLQRSHQYTLNPVILKLLVSEPLMFFNIIDGPKELLFYVGFICSYVPYEKGKQKSLKYLLIHLKIIVNHYIT